jgi:hypothetical protein
VAEEPAYIACIPWTHLLNPKFNNLGNKQTNKNLLLGSSVETFDSQGDNDPGEHIRYSFEGQAAP